jgi:Folliculin-interacting protein middle domain
LQEDLFAVHVVQQLRDALLALLSSPRLPSPVWLSMLASPVERPRHISTFLRSFHQLGKRCQNE